MSKMEVTKEASDRYFTYLAARHGVADSKASAYRFRILFERQREILLAEIGDAPGRFFDLGCGVGMISQPLVRKGIPVVALDYNAAACVGAAAAGLTVCRGDAMKLPFPDASFDTVLISEIIQYIAPERINHAVAEACRLVAPGGRALFVWRNGRSLLHLIAEPIFAFLDRLKGKEPVRLFAPTLDAVANAVRPCGLSISHSMTFSPLTKQIFQPATRLVARMAGSTYFLVACKPPRAGSQ